jgi:hypothetical protein
MGMISEMSVDLLDGKSAYLLSDEQLNRLITVLGNERERREEEAKNKAIQDFHKAWLKLRELNITPRSFSRNVYYDSDEGIYYMDLNDFDFNF